MNRRSNRRGRKPHTAAGAPTSRRWHHTRRSRSHWVAPMDRQQQSSRLPERCANNRVQPKSRGAGLVILQPGRFHAARGRVQPRRQPSWPSHEAVRVLPYGPKRTTRRTSTTAPWQSAWHAWRVTNANDAAANIRLAINVMAAHVVGDEAQLSWSKAEDAMRQEQYRQKGRQ
jgi:hypothetical protein